jgi:CRP-like cAMP-binding protein
MTMRDQFGDVVMRLTAEAGSLLGLPGVVGNCPYSLSAMALAGAGVSFISRDDFRTFMLTDPGAAMMILRVLAAEVRTARVAACKE